MPRKWVANRWLALLLALALALPLAGCAYNPSQAEVQGGAVGAGAGAVAGALISGWKGGVMGAVIGAMAGATITHIATRASREAATHQKPVAYTDDSGTRRVEAYPVASAGKCHTVKEKFYENGKLVREESRKVCD